MLKADNNLSVSIQPSSLFPSLFLSWQYNNSQSSKSVTLMPLYSLNSNIEMKIDFSKNSSGYIFTASSVKTLKKINKLETFIDSRYFSSYEEIKSYHIGSTSFQGCFTGGRNVDIEIHHKDCPLDFGNPCEKKGRYLLFLKKPGYKLKRKNKQILIV